MNEEIIDTNVGTTLTKEIQKLSELPDTEVVSKVNAAAKLAENAAIAKEVLKYGDVPIIYRPTKAMLKKPAEPGLSTLIENAMTVQEVKNLLTKGELDYKNASQKTIKRWKRTADQRIKELSK